MDAYLVCSRSRFKIDEAKPKIPFFFLSKEDIFIDDYVNCKFRFHNSFILKSKKTKNEKRKIMFPSIFIMFPLLKLFSTKFLHRFSRVTLKIVIHVEIAK